VVSSAASSAEAHWNARRYEAAARDYALAADADPADVMSRFNLGVTLRVLGRLDEAIEAWRRVVGTPQYHLRALAQIADTRAEAVSEAEAAELIADPTAESQFAAGRLLERAGEYDRAFAAFAAGNRLHRATLPIPPEQSAAQHEAALAAMRTIFTPPFIAEQEGEGHESEAPIFIVGMPRSGSTLLEQILASHRDVEGMGETEVLAPRLRGRFPYPPQAPKAPGHFREMGAGYLQAVRDFGWTGSPHFVDKTLANEGAVGVIHLMLPNAKILHSRRDPVDTCLSCYFQRFAAGNFTLYDLGDIGRRYQRHRRTMEHWARVLPGKVTDIVNEDLVSDPDRGIRAAVASAGLSWDPACLSFHETQRPVFTASTAQVRRPINAGSVQRWRRYERHLGPLLEAMGPYAP
jgi:tetratricopeptide (TPR) repeat protein